jgi:metal-responsive CopG/Arc/MetJ family transcriptional regulator
VLQEGYGDKPMSKQKMVQLNIRVPQTLKKLMKEYIELDAHKDLSELTRDALREKIQRDAPHLYKNLFKEGTQK